jgi:hypothetical protein
VPTPTSKIFSPWTFCQMLARNSPIIIFSMRSVNYPLFNCVSKTLLRGVGMGDNSIFSVFSNIWSSVHLKKRRLFAKRNKATLISLCSRGRATSVDIGREFRPLRLVRWALQGAQLWKGKRSHFFNWIHKNKRKRFYSSNKEGLICWYKSITANFCKFVLTKFQVNGKRKRSHFFNWPYPMLTFFVIKKLGIEGEFSNVQLQQTNGKLRTYITFKFPVINWKLRLVDTRVLSYKIEINV